MSDSSVASQVSSVGTQDTGTIAIELAQPPSLSETRTAMSILNDNIGFGRSKAKILNEDYGNLHERGRFYEWDVAAADIGKMDPISILNSIADLGFAWRDIARLVGVSVPAIQKWRRGERCSGDNRLNLARVLAACQMIQQHDAVQDIASWFEMPILLGTPITPLDLYEQQQHHLLFEYSGSRIDPEQTLTAFDPEWRENYQTDFEVFADSDGELSIRPKEK